MENERVEKRQARQAVYDGLAFHKIAFEVTEHKAVGNMAELSDVAG